MTPSARTLVAMAAAVALSLELGVVAAEVRSTPVAVRAAAPVRPVELAVAPALSDAAAVEIARPQPAPPAAKPAAPSRPRRRIGVRRRTPPAPVKPACPPTPRVPATRATRARAVDGSVAIYSTPGAAKPARAMANP